MNQVFQTTQWSLVLAARTGTTPRSREALARLCEAYWSPLYAYIRRQGHGVEEARDLTQSYFVRLLEKKYLKNVTPEAGKFRSFLLASLKNFLANEREWARALRRCGQSISLDTHAAERSYLKELSDDLTPEEMYEWRWALEVLERVRARLHREFEAAGMLQRFDRLNACLSGEEPRLPYRKLAADLDMSENAVKVAVHRLRRRFGKLLREEIAQTLADPSHVDVDEEVRYLLNVIVRRTPGRTSFVGKGR